MKIFFNCLIIIILLLNINGFKLFNIENSQIKLNDELIEIIDYPDLIKNGSKYRIDCLPEKDEYKTFCQENLSKNETTSEANKSCIQRGCLIDNNVDMFIPKCYIPLEKGGYQLKEGPTIISNKIKQYKLNKRLTKSKLNKNFNEKMSLYDNDIEELNVDVTISGPDKIRLKITDKTKSRYEVPVPIKWEPSDINSIIYPQIQFELTKTIYDQIGFRIKRTNTQSILFDTTFFSNGFIYDDQFIQIITTIPSINVYGFGENTHPSFRHKLVNSSRYGIFARDQWPTGFNQNLYGTHPFYMVIEPDGQTFGVFIFNSNAQDYKFDSYENDKSILTYRTIGGILDIFFFSGPTPENVIRQYQTIIGYPYLPPYWALGFQLCRYGYDSLNNMISAMNRTRNANIPIDIQYGDIDYFHNRLDFTYNLADFNGLPEYIHWLHNNGMKFITILDPAIDSQSENYSTFIQGELNQIWIKWPKDLNLQFNETGNLNMVGYVWPDGKTVFPDFFNRLSIDWWKKEIFNFYQKIQFDGIWIDMNEPANFDTNKDQPWNWNLTIFRNSSWNLHCPVKGQSLDNPPYKTGICGDYLSDKTLCMVGEQHHSNGNIYKHYDVHNLYGWSETEPTLLAARLTNNKRSIVISRSTFPTSGHFSGHWLGDNQSLWPHLKYNIIGMLEFNLFGIPYIGADICGFIGNTTDRLCQRWMQLGAFNPFFRNHNGNSEKGIKYIDQDPANFPKEIVDSNRRAVELRYSLNPYLYTLFYRVHISGGTVVRSMAHVFPQISQCWDLDEQFLWGSALIIAPVIYENHINKSVYLPTSERWFDYYNGYEITKLGDIVVSAPYDFIPLFIRGGYIIPHQESAMNTVLSRKKPLYLIVALDKNNYAQGDLFWDDGESIDTYQNEIYNYFNFEFRSERLILQPFSYHYLDMKNEVKLNSIQIYGFNKNLTQIFWNDQQLISTNQWTFNSTNMVLYIDKLNLDLSKIHKFRFV